MELVAMELKHSGCYIARTLSYHVRRGRAVGAAIVLQMHARGGRDCTSGAAAAWRHPATHPPTRRAPKQNVSFEQVHVPVADDFRRMYDAAAQLWRDVSGRRARARARRPGRLLARMPAKQPAVPPACGARLARPSPCPTYPVCPCLARHTAHRRCRRCGRP